LQHVARLRPANELGRLGERAPAVLGVLLVQDRLPFPRRLGCEGLAGDLVVGVRVPQREDGVRLEPGLLAELPDGRLVRRLARLDAAGDEVPVGVGRRAEEHERLLAAVDEHERLLSPSHAGKTISARSPPSLSSESVPRSSSRTSARTIERPVPCLGSPAIPFPSSAIASTTSPFRCQSSIVTDGPPCSSAFWKSSLKTSASAVARLPASEIEPSVASTLLSPASPWTSIARSRSSSSPRSTSSSRCSISTSCTAAIARIRLTESSSAFRGSTPSSRAC